MNKEQPTILMLGAGWEQEELVKTIRDNGFRIAATYPSPIEECRGLVDEFYQIDSRDIDGHREIAEKVKPLAIITDNCDYCLLTASVIANELGLPFVSMDSALTSNDKSIQRSKCSNAGILQPAWKVVNSRQKAVKAAEYTGFPLILKPVDNRGTFGVTVVREASKFKKAWDEAESHSHSGKVIVESFIEGTLVTVDGFCFSDGHRALTIATRKFDLGPKPVTNWIEYPARVSDQVARQLLGNHEMVVQALPYRLGHTHGEYILTPEGEIFLVECTNRGAGVYTSSVINPWLTGIDLNQILLDQALGIDQSKRPPFGPHNMKKAAILTFVEFAEKRQLRSIRPIYDLTSPNLLRFRTNIQPGDKIPEVNNCAARHAVVCVGAATPDRTHEMLDSFMRNLQIEYEPLVFRAELIGI